MSQLWSTVGRRNLENSLSDTLRIVSRFNGFVTSRASPYV